MQKFKIVGIKNTKKVSMILKAQNQEIAYQKALQKQIVPISITPLNIKIKKIFSVNNEEYLVCLEQIYLLLQSFIPLDEILQHCIKTSSPKLQEILSKIVESLKQGITLSQSFQAFGMLLSPTHYALLEIGNKTGKLQESFMLIIQDIKAKKAYQKQMQKALFYPCIVLLGIVIAFFVAIFFILPEFQSFFLDNEAKLPLITRSLIMIETLIRSFGAIILSCCLFAYFGFCFLCKKNQSLRIFLHYLLVHFPLFGKIILYHRLHLFFQSLYYFQISGIDLQNALLISLKTLDNSYLQLHLKDISSFLMQGDKLSLSFGKTLFFDSITLALLSSGEQSGNIDKIFLKISDRYEKLKQNLLEKILLYIDPIATSITALMVLYLALGIFLPIWQIQDQAFL